MRRISMNEVIEQAIAAIKSEIEGRAETHHQRITDGQFIAAMVVMVPNTSPKVAIPEQGIPEHRTGRVNVGKGYLQISYKGLPDNSTKFQKSTGRPVPAIVYHRKKMVRGTDVDYLTCVRLPNAVGPLPLELVVGENPEGMLSDPAPKAFGGEFSAGWIGFRSFVYDPVQTAETVARMMAEEMEPSVTTSTLVAQLMADEPCIADATSGAVEPDMSDPDNWPDRLSPLHG